MPDEVVAQNPIEKKIRARLEKEHEEQITDSAGELHNQIVGYITEKKLPLELVLLVLDILREETIESCRRKYLGV